MQQNQDMVYNASSFVQNLGSKNISKVTSKTEFLRNEKFTRSNFENTLLGKCKLDTAENNIPSNLKVSHLNF